MSLWSCDRLIRRVQGIPLVVWILAAFLLAYLLFFLRPVFLQANVMQQFPAVAAAGHLGIDLKMRLGWSAYSLDPALPIPDGDGTVFPPFANLLFVPLLGLRFPTAFALLSLTTVLLYVASSLILPMLMSSDRRFSRAAVLVCTTGLVSYGVQFELERGQWNVVAVFLVLLAIWIFHWHPRQRLLAYALFVISVQLKVYPVVFIALFISDWRRWRENLLRLALLAGANFALFFVQGMRALQIWYLGLMDWSANPWIWEGNPSIESAVALLSQYATRQGGDGISAAAGFIEVVLTLSVIACLGFILLHSLRRPGAAPSPHYLLAAAIGCLLIPSGGYDYRLSMLGGPMVVLLLAEESNDGRGSLRRRAAVFLLAFAYATTLFPPDQKPYYLANNFPALFVMVGLVTLLALTSIPSVEQGIQSLEDAPPGGASRLSQSG